MNGEMLLINEGAVLDDKGNMIMTTYIDLRPEEERSAISALVRGCRREHALEDGATILISKPARFREYGEGLIQDDQEGFAKEEVVTPGAETAIQAARKRAVADVNEAFELTGSRVRVANKVTFSNENTENKSLSFGKDWWIFCASIEPNEGEWESWRTTLPKEYEHVSEIGQPAKFAQALARMVTEQVGPQGKNGSFSHTTEDGEVVRTRHRHQWVIHGPVIYTDQLYDTFSGKNDGIARLAAFIFTKSTDYAAQREYRFAVLNEDAEEETVLLRISGMMRDSLMRTERGLVRIAPAHAAKAKDDETPSRTNSTQTLVNKRTTTTERLTEREDRRWETRTPDGQVISSESDKKERVAEKLVTQEHQPDDNDFQATARRNQDDYTTTQGQIAQEPMQRQDRSDDDREPSDEEAVQELALEERERGGGRFQCNDSPIVVHSGTGRAYSSFDSALKDPAFPIGPARVAWQEARCSPEEIVKTFGAMELLTFKMGQIREECRQDIASAGWHAMLCVRNIHAHLGDVVDSLWIERERFVVIHLKESGNLKATGRIVVSPSGAYAYCLQLTSRETSGWGGEKWGPLFFPMGDDIESFETFGWPGKIR